MNKYKCSEIQELLPLYADNVLSSDESAFVEEHIINCKECKDDLLMYQKMMQSAKDIPTLTVSNSFASVLKENINEINKERLNSQKRYRRKWIPYTASISAAVVALSIISFRMLSVNDINSSQDLYEIHESKAHEEASDEKIHEETHDEEVHIDKAEPYYDKKNVTSDGAENIVSENENIEKKHVVYNSKEQQPDEDSHYDTTVIPKALQSEAEEPGKIAEDNNQKQAVQTEQTPMPQIKESVSVVYGGGMIRENRSSSRSQKKPAGSADVSNAQENTVTATITVSPKDRPKVRKIMSEYEGNNGVFELSKDQYSDAVTQLYDIGAKIDVSVENDEAFKSMGNDINVFETYDSVYKESSDTAPTPTPTPPEETDIDTETHIIIIE